MLKFKNEQKTYICIFLFYNLGVYEKLEKIGNRKSKGFAIVGRWARSISNHIYWCAASSNGDGEMVQQKYASILNHISNIHEGHGEKFPQCAHDVSEDREWIKQGTKTVY